MSVVKKILAGVLIVALVGVSGAGALNYIKKSREVEVLVVPVDSLTSDYYMEDTVLDGNITTNVSQNIRVDNDMIVDEMFVSDGDVVSVGDPLVSFDLTLVQMELNIARLKQQQIQNELAKAVKRLESLKNGGPIVEENNDDLSFGDTDDDSMEAMSEAVWKNEGFVLASVMPGFLLASVEDFYEDEFTEEVMSERPEADSDGSDSPVADNPEIGNHEETVTDPSENIVQEPEQEIEIPSIEPEEDMELPDDFVLDPDIFAPDNQLHDDETTIIQPEKDPVDEDPFASGEVADELDTNPEVEKNEDFLESDIVFYKRIDENTKPFMGTGTEEDPFVFLCSSENENVIVTGGFLNTMAGYNADGSKILHKGGYWYQLEFHDNDELLSTEDRKQSCTGYFLIDGSLLEEPLPPNVEMEYLLSDALTYDDLGDDDWGDDWDFGGGGGSSSTISREEAIRTQINRVNALKIELQEGALGVAKLENKAKNQTVYSKIDGIISTDSSSFGGSGNLLTVKSMEGYYVRGSVSELLLDDLTEGSSISCMSYQSGRFDATVVDVADYPTSGSSGFWGSDSNPNVSYYTFSASIDDKSLNLMDGDWLQITMKNKADSGKKLVLSRAFVRSENGKNYVYKEVDGVLKKQYVKIGGNVDYGYSVIIKAGLTSNDYIAFPYGKAVVEGAKVREGTSDELYDY